MVNNSLDLTIYGNILTSMNWDDLRYFASFAASGSLSAAARALNVEHATIARRIAALESDLNLKLLDRRGRKLLLTAEGEQIAAIADKMEFTAEEVLGHARSMSSELCGKVTISAPPAFAAVMLAAPLAVMLAAPPSQRLRFKRCAYRLA